jgi:hypothetical protein
MPWSASAHGRIELVDETFVAAAPALVHDAFVQRREANAWWPHWSSTVFMDRGRQGTRWSVSGDVHGLPAVGSAEIWLEPVLDGVVVHHFLRLDVAASPRRCARAQRRYARRWKQRMAAFKDRLEAGRTPGSVAVGSSPAVDLPRTGG